MSKLQLRAFIYQFIGFFIFFLAIRFLIIKFTTLEGFIPSFIAFLVGTFFAPKFMATKTKDGEKLFMSWLFMKGIREIGSK
jgi:hypothetical protein